MTPPTSHEFLYKLPICTPIANFLFRYCFGGVMTPPYDA